MSPLQIRRFADWGLKAVWGRGSWHPRWHQAAGGWPCLAGAPPCNCSLGLFLPAAAAGSCATFRKAGVVVGFLWAGGVIL